LLVAIQKISDLSLYLYVTKYKAAQKNSVFIFNIAKDNFPGRDFCEAHHSIPIKSNIASEWLPIRYNLHY